MKTKSSLARDVSFLDYDSVFFLKGIGDEHYVSDFACRRSLSLDLRLLK